MTTSPTAKQLDDRRMPLFSSKDFITITERPFATRSHVISQVNRWNGGDLASTTFTKTTPTSESRGDLWLRRTESLSLAPPGLNQTAAATAVSTMTPQRLCCPQQSTSDTATPAAATAFCQNDASTSLLPQQQSSSVTPQRLCCRNSRLQV